MHSCNRKFLKGGRILDQPLTCSLPKVWSRYWPHEILPTVAWTVSKKGLWYHGFSLLNNLIYLRNCQKIDVLVISHGPIYFGDAKKNRIICVQVLVLGSCDVLFKDYLTLKRYAFWPKPFPHPLIHGFLPMMDTLITNDYIIIQHWFLRPWGPQLRCSEKFSCDNWCWNTSEKMACRPTDC